jgi:hypothetical protein
MSDQVFLIFYIYISVGMRKKLNFSSLKYFEKKLARGLVAPSGKKTLKIKKKIECKLNYYILLKIKNHENKNS